MGRPGVQIVQNLTQGLGSTYGNFLKPGQGEGFLRQVGGNLINGVHGDVLKLAQLHDHLVLQVGVQPSDQAGRPVPGQLGQGQGMDAGGFVPQ